MCYLCERYDKPTASLHYIAGVLVEYTGTTLLDSQMCSRNTTHSHVEDIQYKAHNPQVLALDNRVNVSYWLN